MPVIREIIDQGWRFRFDLSPQVLGVEVPKEDWEWGRTDKEASLLLPTPPQSQGLVSASMLLFKAKQFDDGLYAAVELAAQRGLGKFNGKSSLLRSLAESQPPAAAAAVLYAACRLGQIPVVTPEHLADGVQGLVDHFLA